MKTKIALPPMQGRVIVERMIAPTNLEETTRRKITRWMGTQRFVGTQKSDPRFLAIFSRDDETPMVDCHIEVRWGSQTWTSTKFGYGAEEALKNALTNMVRKLSGDLYGEQTLGAA